MKKAFTLVEISVVLVVIGILMSMTIVISNVISTSRTKADILAIQKIKNTVIAYATEHDYIIPNSFSLDSLIKDGYLGASDLNLSKSRLKADDMIRVTRGVGMFQSVSKLDASLGLSIETSSSPRDDLILGCILDDSLDDGMSGRGDVMYLGSPGRDTPISADDCKKASFNNPVARSYSILLLAR